MQAIVTFLFTCGIAESLFGWIGYFRLRNRVRNLESRYGAQAPKRPLAERMFEAACGAPYIERWGVPASVSNRSGVWRFPDGQGGFVYDPIGPSPNAGTPNAGVAYPDKAKTLEVPNYRSQGF